LSGRFSPSCRQQLPPAHAAAQNQAGRGLCRRPYHGRGRHAGSRLKHRRIVLRRERTIPERVRALLRLAAGSLVGVFFARWRVKREVASGILKTYTLKPGEALVKDKPRPRWRQPLIAVVVLLVALAVVELFITQGHTNVAVYLLFAWASASSCSAPASA